MMSLCLPDEHGTYVTPVLCDCTTTTPAYSTYLPTTQHTVDLFKSVYYQLDLQVGLLVTVFISVIFLLKGWGARDENRNQA